MLTTRGWTIASDLNAVTLRDIYAALGEPERLAMGNRTEMPGCLVEQAVNAALSDAFAEAKALLLDRFGEISRAQRRLPRSPQPKGRRANPGDPPCPLMSPSPAPRTTSAGPSPMA